ncbi:MAG: AAA family ATPase [Nanoarchaeota archaeon]
MLFKKLKLKNIRSYEDLEINFPNGSILLSGDIGAGKTSILLALQFALFGLQPGQKGASILRQGEDSAYVSLEIEIEGNQITLERNLKKSKSISQESNALTINGEKKELSTSEMKNKVIEMLNYPHEFVKKSNLLYKFTVYTPQEEMKSIIEEKPETRLDTIRHIFGIDRYKNIQENSQIFLQKIKEAIKIKEVEIREINTLKEKLIQENEKRIKLSKEINNLNIEYNVSLNVKQESNERLNQINLLIEEKRKIDSELSAKRIQIQGKNELKERLEKEILIMQRQINDKIEFSNENLNNAIESLKKHKSGLDNLNLKFLDINSNISILNSKKEHSQNLKEKIICMENCPTCFQNVTKDHKSKIEKMSQFDIEEVDRELEIKIFNKNKLIKDIEAEKKLIQEFEKMKSELESAKIRFEHQKTIETKIKSDSFIFERSLQEIKNLENQISELKIKLQGFQEYENLFEIEKSNFDKLDICIRNLQISLAEKNKEIEILKIHLENLESQISEKEKIKEQINYLKELQAWLEEKFLFIISAIEMNVMAKLREEFSKLFNEWFSILVSDALNVRLDEDFTPIISQKDFEVDYEFLSGGERTAVALAYRLSLNQILNSLLSKIKTKDIIILDEPTDGFSEQQIDKMRDIFSQLNSKQIILVSHEQKIEGFVDNVIKIKKDRISGIAKN